MRDHSREKGFTIIELLIVIGIIGFLAAAILVAVDPVKRIQDARDSERWSEVNTLLSGILKWQVDNRAQFFGGEAGDVGDNRLEGNVIIPGSNIQMIIDNSGSTNADITTIDCTSAVAATICPGAPAGSAISANDGECMADLGRTTGGIVGDYIAELPVDPGDLSVEGTTGYYINVTTNGRITIGSCEAENATILVKR